MIEETGIVVAVRGELAEVETMRRSACAGCSVNGACGTSLLERILGRKQLILTASNRIGARPGESVVLGVPEAALLEAAFAAYLIPIIAMIAGGIVAEHRAETLAPGFSPGLSVVGGAAGLAAGLWWLARFSANRSGDERYRPVILKRGGGDSVQPKNGS